MEASRPRGILPGVDTSPSSLGATKPIEVAAATAAALLSGSLARWADDLNGFGMPISALRGFAFGLAHGAVFDWVVAVALAVLLLVSVATAEGAALSAAVPLFGCLSLCGGLN